MKGLSPLSHFNPSSKLFASAQDSLHKSDLLKKKTHSRCAWVCTIARHLQTFVYVCGIVNLRCRCECQPNGNTEYKRDVTTDECTRLERFTTECCRRDEIRSLLLVSKKETVGLPTQTKNLYQCRFLILI